MKNKRCTKCGRYKPLSGFHREGAENHQAWCKDCKREYKREYIKRPEVKTKQRATYERLKDEGYFREYHKKQSQDPRLRVRFLARWYAKRMVRTGVIEKQPCAECGEAQSQMHHPDYDHPLLIVWLCQDCHKALHKRMKGE